ncbi:MAG: penicillin-binding protein activator [Geoalkalibacter sp.]|uniref:ABC transporter substrate-binding protein n=1 Tax=Geoalkalibacter sp. TaxID=3041440 RepID=UPI003D0EE591
MWRSTAVRLILAALVIFSGLLLSAAAQMSSQQSTSRTAGPEALEVRRAADLYREGNLDEALRRLRGFVIRNPYSPWREQAYLYLARIFHDRDDCEEALLYLDRLEQEPKADIAELMRGSCLVRMGRYSQALEHLLPLRESDLDDSDRALLAGRIGQAQAALGQPLQSLVFLDQAAELDEHPERWLSEAHRILREADASVLEEASFMFRGRAVGQDADLQLALRAADAHQDDRALSLLARIMADPTPFPYRDQARSLLARIDGSGTATRNALGVVLPLSGRYESFGELVRRGMELALELHHQGGNPLTRFIYRDSGADAARATDAVATLAGVDGVMAVAGPLTGEASRGAALEAQRRGVPLVSLSPRAGLPEVGDFVFRNSLTSEQQARALAGYAVEDLNLYRYAILAPEEGQGRELADFFAAQVERKGGRVVKRQNYPPDLTDFRVQIKRLLGQDPNAPEPQNEDREPSPPPFDALLIPDYAEMIGLIAPQLAYYDLTDVQLLGINGWNSPQLLERAGRFVEGAVFVDGFFAGSPDPIVREFVALYRETHGQEPSILEAQAFDTAGLLLYLLGRPDVDSREDLRRALASVRNYPGVTGTLSVDDRGEILRELFLIRVEQGAFVQIDRERNRAVPLPLDF